MRQRIRPREHFRRGNAATILIVALHKPRKLAAVALANKTARVAWALMAHGEVYRRSDAFTGAAAA